MSDAVNRYEEALAQATAKGLRVIAPKPNELFVDIDDQESCDRSVKVLTLLQRVFENDKTLGSVEWTYSTSPSGRPGRFHMVVTMPFDLSHAERIAYQAILASDPVREILSLLRLRRGDSVPTLFFEKKLSTEEPAVATEET